MRLNQKQKEKKKTILQKCDEEDAEIKQTSTQASFLYFCFQSQKF
jgi:hypothetical protein